MSSRNTGLFVAGHVSPEVVGAALWSTPGLDAALFVGEEAVRVGHGTRQGRAYTHVGLRLFEEGGLRLMDQAALPGPEEPEQHLAATLSARYGQAVYLFYDEENGAGGAAVFVEGRLVARDCFDARGLGPVHRSSAGTEQALVGLDPSDWIWRPAAEAIAAAAHPVVGPGVRDDDDIAALVEAVHGTTVALEPPAIQASPAATVTTEATEAREGMPRRRRRDRVWGFLRGWTKE